MNLWSQFSLQYFQFPRFDGRGLKTFLKRESACDDRKSGVINITSSPPSHPKHFDFNFYLREDLLC